MNLLLLKSPMKTVSAARNKVAVGRNGLVNLPAVAVG